MQIGHFDPILVLQANTVSLFAYCDHRKTRGKYDMKKTMPKNNGRGCNKKTNKFDNVNS
jgi:hypothetical protein